VRQTQAGLVYEQPLGGGNRLRAMVYQGQRATVQYQAIPVAAQASPLHPGGVIDLNRSYGGADVRLTAQAHLAELPLELVAGLAYDSLREHRLGYQNFSGATLGVQGALRRDETTASAAWTLMRRPPSSFRRAGRCMRACAAARCALIRPTTMWRAQRQRQRQRALQRHLAGGGPAVRACRQPAFVRHGRQGL
jgi:hypothetical protein